MSALPSVLPGSLLPSTKNRSGAGGILAGVQGIDRTGGIPSAALTDVAGTVSSGRTSFLLSMFRAAMAQGHCCVLVDAQDGFDPQTAARAGVDLARLLWVRCQGADQALKAADLLVHAGGFGVVVIDLSGTPPTVAQRIPAAWWFRLRRGAEQSGCALVVTGEQPLTGSCAQLQVRISRDHLASSGKLLRGWSARAECRKGRPGLVADFRVVR